jgi:chromosome segregation protein
MLTDARQTRLDLGGQQEDFVVRAEALAEQVGRGEAQVETLRTEAHRRRSRLQSLIEIQERYEGFARGTRAVMQQPAAPTGDADAVRGLVADVLRAPETLEVAVEAALGDQLGGVLVRDAGVGVQAISYLKTSGGGRSTFVPLAVPQAVDASWGWEAALGGSGAIEVEDRTTLNAALAAVGGEGVIGRMTDLVELADGYEAVGRKLLDGKIVVDTLDRAVALHHQGITDTLVTLATSSTPAARSAAARARPRAPACWRRSARSASSRTSSPGSSTISPRPPPRWCRARPSSSS